MTKTARLLLKAVLLSFMIFIFREDVNMVDMYVALVINGRRTCNEENKSVPLVPKKWRAKVLEDLEALGLDGDGNEKE